MTQRYDVIGKFRDVVCVACQTCGALVADMGVHDAWHDRVEAS